ncbi:EF-hand domain-containing protein [Variovorax sp. LT2P21]|uniref:EF-hand domain-containing protein n=1 Tax=Variovorax sp. LT2P21 TaxID=3443731 RepID=UPI003F484BA7
MKLARPTHCLATSAGAALLVLASVAACAQAPAGQRAERMQTELHKRFSAADTNVDGQLTRDEASKMPWVSKNFDAIDTTRKGSVTMTEIEAYAMTQRGARQAGK